jgi:hypothetical protein
MGGLERTLHRDYYLSEIFRLERERIFARSGSAWAGKRRSRAG